jgi:hypothetical protein
MEKKFNFVYITTNLINNKRYIGDHATNNLNDNYLGSGLGIHNAIKKYGKKNFKKEILEFFSSKKEAYESQEKYISEYNTLKPNGYNNNKRGGYGITGLNSEQKSLKLSKANKGKKISEEHKNAIRLFMSTFKHTEETKQKLRKPKSKTDKYKESKIGEKNPMYHISLYELWVKKFGKEIADEKQKERGRKISIANSKRTLSQKTKDKIGYANKNKPKILCIYCNRFFSSSNYSKWHGEKCKHKNAA